MSANDAITGIGAKFRRWNGTRWVNLSNVLSVGGPNLTRSTIDVTTFDSTSGYKEFIAGLRDGGTFQASMLFTRANYDLMKEDFESDALQNYQFELQDTENSCFEFSGLVVELPLNTPLDDKVTADVSIQISGEVVLNSGSS